MPEVAILIGLQASGKTTFYRQVLAATHEHVSKDAFPNARRPQQRQLRLVTEALTTGRDVAVDNTNPSVAEWAPLIAVAHAHNARAVGYWFPVDVELSRTRNAARDNKTRVPDVGFYATLKRLRRPRLTDGFDALYEVTANTSGTFVVRPLEGRTECRGTSSKRVSEPGSGSTD